MIFLILLMLFQPMPAKAQETAIVDEDLICLNATLKAEEEYQIQKHLLTSISTVETGRWNQRLQQKTAWPWTVNVKGRGYFYKTKAEAIAAVKDWQRRGYKSIDVGCMQVNLRFHGKKFANLEEAFDPNKNVEVAARYLKKRHETRGDWLKAATDYHSKRPSKANRYKTKLLAAMDNIKAIQEQNIAQYASNFLVIKDNRGWFSRWFNNDKDEREIKLSLRG